MYKKSILTILLRGSLTGAVTSKKVTEVCIRYFSYTSVNNLVSYYKIYKFYSAIAAIMTQ